MDEGQSVPDGKGPICLAKKGVSKKVGKILTGVNENINNISAKVTKAGKKGLDDIKKLRQTGQRIYRTARTGVKNSYLGMSWRHRRPDLTLLMEILLLVSLLVIGYYMWPYFTSTVKPNFTQEQLLKASSMPQSSFSLEELANVDLEVKSLGEYARFFEGGPYSIQNTGIPDLLISVAVFPLIMIFVQFVLPPLVISYILWFIIRFWPYVIRAAWGWFIMMYRYFTNLITGKLGCKWYIRMVTGWSCRGHSFYSYFVEWRRRYIDRPIYYEKLRYIRKYYQARDEYVIKPYNEFVVKPLRRYRIHATYAKQVYVDRAIEVFLKGLRDSYPQFYTMPRDEFYRWLLGQNRYLAGVFARAMQAKAQIEGRPYRSITEQGKQCMCPASKTPVRTLKKRMKKQLKDAVEDVEMLAKITRDVYDKANKVTKKAMEVSRDCETADTLIKNRRSVASYMLLGSVLAMLGLGLWSYLFGTPLWLRYMMKPTSTWLNHGHGLVKIGSTINSLPIFYAVVGMLAMLLVRFY
jgi:hypothetical protein